jgi:SAM-dependent methyltransferase
VKALREAAVDHGLTNVVPLVGSEADANLPEACCDAIFMSKVYHHFTRPGEMNASLYKALKPGGRLAVIDFEPRWWRFWLSLPDGVPPDRGGHGMPMSILIAEMEEAGFVLKRPIPEWWRFPEERYCLIFRKSESN